jgi:hypothetical protein
VSDFADTNPNLRGRGAVVGLALAAAASTSVAVSIGGQAVTVKTSRALAVAAGDLVSCVRHGSTWYVLAVLGPAALDLAAVAADAAPDVRPPARTGRFVIHPVDTATYRASAGWRDDTTDLLQGDQSGTGRLTGAALYGTKATALAGATVTNAIVKLQRLDGGDFTAAAPTLKKVTEATRPAGAPTLTGSAAGPSLRPGDTADVDITTAWGQALVDGTIGGLAIDVAADTPYLRLAGRDSWAAGMTVVLDWRRDG